MQYSCLEPVLSDVLLQGVVGSTAYGLNTEDSDIDYLGIFAAPTDAFFGLDPIQQTRVTHNPDSTLHEAGKFCRLALQCNPTVLELLWLDRYERSQQLGMELLLSRTAFLSAKRVRDAYFGYATQQFQRLKMRGDSFSSDTKKRTAKHARHMARLLFQGFVLYQTGQLPVHLMNPQWFHDFGNVVAAGGVEAAENLVAIYEEKFNRHATALPAKPDQVLVAQWLKQVRYENLSRSL